MDGVIVDSAKYHFKAWQELATQLSIDFTVRDNEDLKGLSRVDSLEKILNLGSLYLDNDTKLALMDQKNARYLEYIESMGPDEILPGVAEFLATLKEKGIKIGLGSSSKNAMRILKAIEIEHFFDAVMDGNQVTFSKPDPEVFLKGAEAMEVLPEETVVFEDAVAGVVAAKNGGFTAIGVGDEEALNMAHAVIPGFADFTFDDLEECFELIQRTRS